MTRRAKSLPAKRPQRAAGRTPLSNSEILELDAALIRAFRTIQELRQSYSAARHIKYPPLPPIFSESLVIASAPRLFGHGWVGRFGGKLCDVMIEHSEHGTKRVEVKATAEHAFQEFKAKDLKADTLVWVRFGRRFRDGAGQVEVVLLENPGDSLAMPCRLDKQRFERLIGREEGLRVLCFASLEELLDLGSGSTS